MSNKGLPLDGKKKGSSIYAITQRIRLLSIVYKWTLFELCICKLCHDIDQLNNVIQIKFSVLSSFDVTCLCLLCCLLKPKSQPRSTNFWPGPLSSTSKPKSKLNNCLLVDWLDRVLRRIGNISAMYRRQ